MRPVDPYVLGYDAYCDRIKLARNPYHKQNKHKHAEWIRGWKAAERISNTPIIPTIK